MPGNEGNQPQPYGSLTKCTPPCSRFAPLGSNGAFTQGPITFGNFFELRRNFHLLLPQSFWARALQHMTVFCFMVGFLSVCQLCLIDQESPSLTRCGFKSQGWGSHKSESFTNRQNSRKLCYFELLPSSCISITETLECSYAGRLPFSLNLDRITSTMRLESHNSHHHSDVCVDWRPALAT